MSTASSQDHLPTLAAAAAADLEEEYLECDVAVVYFAWLTKL